MPPTCIIVSDSWWGSNWDGQWDYSGTTEDGHFYFSNARGYHLVYTEKVSGYAFKSAVSPYSFIWGYCAKDDIMECTTGNWMKYDWTERGYVVNHELTVSACAHTGHRVAYAPLPKNHHTESPTTDSPTKSASGSPSKSPAKSPTTNSPISTKKVRPTKAPKIKPSKAPKIKPSKVAKTKESKSKNDEGSTRTKKSGRGGGDDQNEDELFFDANQTVQSKQDDNVYNAMLIFSFLFVIIVIVLCNYQIKNKNLNDLQSDETN